MNIISPLPVVPGMVSAGTTIAAVDASVGESAWVANASYVIDDLKVYDGVVYACVQVHTGRAVLPPVDSKYWQAKGPSNRMAPFDYYVSTPARAIGSLTYVLQVGFFGALSVYGLVGGDYSVVVRDAPGGTVLKAQSGFLFANAVGLFELLFVPLQRLQKLVITDIPISPTAELTITVDAGAGLPVEIGLMNIGNRRSLFGSGPWGGVEEGAEAEPISNSYIKTYDDGTVRIEKRHKGTGLRLTVGMPRDQADAVLQVLQEVLDVPVSCIATDVPGFDGLNVFGLLSGTMRYVDFAMARLTLTAKGLI